MAARICPQCRTRVDERRAKASPYCLSCGAPLGTGPQASYGSAAFAGKPVARSPLPWILGGIGAFVVLGFGGCALFLFAAGSSKADTPGPTGAENPTNAPIVETPTAQPPASAVPSVKVVGTIKVPVKVTSPPPPPPPPPTTPVVLGAFPRAQATNDVDRVTAGLGSCKRAGDPTGSGSIRVDFEPDGRVGTVLARPFAGTPTGSCISSRYLSIRVGAFQGAAQSLTRTFSISGSSNNPGF